MIRLSYWAVQANSTKKNHCTEISVNGVSHSQMFNCKLYLTYGHIMQHSF